MKSYDIVIVGAGIAGLFCARENLKRQPGTSLIVCEKYRKLGGRAVSYKKDLGGTIGTVGWEIGAGRISQAHKHVLGLLKEYGLHTFPIKPDLNYRESGRHEFEENFFEPALGILLKPLSALPAETLGTHTLKELLVKLHGAAETQRWMDRYPYHSEVVWMRADRALAEFNGEMGSHEGYFVCKEGLSALIEAMADDVRGRGGEIVTQYDLQSCDGNVCRFQTEQGEEEIVAKESILLALHAAALRNLAMFKGWHILNHVRMEPLFRIYAVFPKGADGRVWFDGLSRVVTPEPIRYFLPMDATKGTAMVSYTDSKFARHYMRIQDTRGEKALESQIVKDLRSVFPEFQIPRPVFFKPHPWTDGVTYWLPGTYSPEAESVEALHPFPQTYPKVYVCNESFCLRQGWMEGSIEHAELLLEKFFSKRR
jgi:monoamine oxidase